MALLHYDAATRSVSLIKKTTFPIPPKYTLGRSLAILFDLFVDFVAPLDTQIYIRERAVLSHFADSDRLLRVGGATDVALFKTKEKVFYDMAPTTIKKILTGNGRSLKETVAKTLTLYIGEQEYVTDDESDAIAAALAFLIKEGYIGDKRDPLSNG